MTQMRAAYEIHKDHDRVKKYNYPSVIQELENAWNHLQSFKGIADKWVPDLDISSEIDELDSRVASLKGAMAKCEKYNRIFTGIVFASKVKAASAKRSWRNHRDGLAKRLRESSLPVAVSKAAADFLQALACDPDAFGDRGADKDAGARDHIRRDCGHVRRTHDDLGYGRLTRGHACYALAP